METLQEHYFSSPASSPDPDLQTLAPERIGVPKRKGGRKPIYATSEERKQRNRQAQAAFRERRSEYIKQLETALKLNEDALRALQQSQRASADECALLQYKNSLLERMMMEKGIDVRAELQVGAIRTPHPATGHISASQPSVDREITPRHQDPQRSNSMFAKLESGQQLPFTTSDVTPACSLPLSSYTSPSPSFISHNFMPQELSAQPSFNQSYREQHKSPRRCKERSLQAPRKPHFLTQIGGPSLKTRISAKSLYNGSSIYPASCHHISQPGNSHDEDSDKEPEPPTRAVEKTLPRTTKRNAPDVAPSNSNAGHGDATADRGARGGRRGGFSANDDAFRDRNAGSVNNRARPTEDLGDARGRGRGGFGGRGGRGARGRVGYPRDDRHSHQLPDTDKRINQGWGGQDGNSEWKDEQAGEAIAQSEEKEGGFDTGVTAPTDLPEGAAEEADGAEASGSAAEAEPEDNHMSYSDYLVERERKKLELGGVLEARKPNQGKQDKKWANAKELKKDDEDEEYIAGSGGKTKAQKERKQKNILDIDQRYVEPSGGRGGRDGGFGRGGGGGRGRGDRGDFRGGDRGRGGRGRGGDFHRGGGNRGGYNNSSRGGQTVNVTDTNAFPVLGGS
ncbi:MAG: hypothetical protein M1829_000983 [Trizodia sp. TS-e1964]|nr:MAG: hypothetical protein M1829_000983 [Trizodia sp. TS-e1964]